MGFFDKMLKGLGFEGEQKAQKPEKIKPEKQEDKLTHTGVSAKYDLQKPKEEKPQPKSFCPQSQVEVQQIVDAIRAEKTLIVDLSNLSQSDYIRGLDFLSGAIYYTKGKIQKVEDKKFYLYPGE